MSKKECSSQDLVLYG